MDIRNSESKKKCKHENGRYIFERAGEHEIRLYVYAKEEEVRSTTWIKFSTLNDRVNFHIDPVVSVDSGYDIKNIKFEVPLSNWKRSEVMLVEFLDDRNEKYGVAQFPMVLELKAQWTGVILSSFFTGLSGSIPAMIVLWRASGGEFPLFLAVLIVLAAWGTSFAGHAFLRSRQ